MQKIILITLFITGMWLPSSAQDGSSIYKALNASSKGLEKDVFTMAYRGFQEIDSASSAYLAVIDYSIPSTEERFFVVDMEKKELIRHLHVAHGKNTGANTADSFSNVPGSKQSSLGFFLTGETYYGKHGYSLNLHGLEPGINDNAYKRRIVIHGAWYVSQEMIDTYGRLGRSWGCPAVAKDASRQVIDLLKEGVCLFIYGSGYSPR